MSEFKAGFIDAYKPNMVAMLDMAERLPLSHVPDIAISSSSLVVDLDFKVQGMPISELSEEQKSSVEVRGFIASNLAHMEWLNRLVVADLVEAETAGLPDKLTECTDDQLEIYDRAWAIAETAVSGADVSYSFYQFEESDKSSKTAIISYSLTSPHLPVRSRYLSTSIVDEQLAEELTIRELPVSTAEDESLDIRYSIRPAEDQAMTEMVDLFEANGLSDGSYVCMQIYEAALNGLGYDQVGLSSVEAHFLASNSLGQFQALVEKIIEKAERDKSRVALNAEFPDMQLPSSLQLESFQRKISELLS